jgi:hypothetical protein
MLTADDIAWIKTNRAEITGNRTESVTLVHATITGVDAYTGEPIVTDVLETVSAVWKEYSSVANGDRDVINGIELRKDDVKATFADTVTLADVSEVQRGGVAYAIITVDEKGIGGKNRYECVLRRVT